MTSIVGTWRLVEATATNAEGIALAPPYGPSPMGILVITANGRIMATACDGGAELPAGQVKRAFSSYCGSYSFDGETLVIRVDAAVPAELMAEEQRRYVSFEGDRLVLRPSPQPAAGRVGHRRLVWERLS